MHDEVRLIYYGLDQFTWCLIQKWQVLQNCVLLWNTFGFVVRLRLSSDDGLICDEVIYDSHNLRGRIGIVNLILGLGCVVTWIDPVQFLSRPLGQLWHLFGLFRIQCQLVLRLIILGHMIHYDELRLFRSYKLLILLKRKWIPVFMIGEAAYLLRWVPEVN